MRIALFATCIVDAMYPEVGRATVRILERLGHEVIFPAGQACCGQMHINSGYLDEAVPALMGMVVKEGAAKPDIGSVDAFRKVLLDAKSIAYSDSGSGTYIANVMYAKLGIADQVAGKSRKVRGPPSGEPVAAVVARGEAEIGFQQVSELIHTSGVTVVGAVPAELQPGFSFAAALTTAAKEPDAAKALIGFLSSPDAVPVVTRMGLAPVDKR